MIIFYFYSLMVIVQSIQILSIDLPIKFHFECLRLVCLRCFVCLVNCSV